VVPETNLMHVGPASNAFSSSAWARTLAALLLTGLAVTACESEPCEGPGCPDACSDQLCAETDGGASGGTSGSGGTAGGSSGTGGLHAGAISGPCQTDTTCDTVHGFACVEGQCRHACRSHFDCAARGTCEPLAGSNETYCVLTGQAAKSGEYYSRCPNSDECAADFLCLGAGPGDADAYCSSGCENDDACPSGFYCTEINGADGRQLSACVRRNFCNTCETDADCLGVPGQICARDQSGAKICTVTCQPGVDACPWGNASVCGVFDAERGVATCAHRAGTCRAEGKSCEPCVRDSDCPTGFCHGSSFTGERWCVDQSVECSCEGLKSDDGVCSGANGCPRTPGNVAMLCYAPERPDGNPFEFHCFGADANGASLVASPQSGCWPPR
jgi:hypothetical protein